MKYYKLNQCSVRTTGIRFNVDFTDSNGELVTKPIEIPARELTGREVAAIPFMRDMPISEIAQNYRYFINNALGIKELVNLSVSDPEDIENKIVYTIQISKLEKYAENMS